jgi:hypothetical protein
MDHQRKWKNVNSKGKRNHRRQKNELKIAAEKTKKEIILKSSVMELMQQMT